MRIRASIEADNGTELQVDGEYEPPSPLGRDLFGATAEAPGRISVRGIGRNLWEEGVILSPAEIERARVALWEEVGT